MPSGLVWSVVQLTMRSLFRKLLSRHLIFIRLLSRGCWRTTAGSPFFDIATQRMRFCCCCVSQLTRCVDMHHGRTSLHHPIERGVTVDPRPSRTGVLRFPWRISSL